MLKLYYMPGSCALASHIALVWASATYELARLDHQGVHADGFLHINPKGAVPVLVQEENGRSSTIITESLAVLLWIADMHPAAALGAKSGDLLGRVRLNEILAELVSEVHKAFGPVFAPQRFAVDDKCRDGAKQAAYRQLNTIFDRLERRMGGQSWVALDRRSVAECISLRNVPLER